MELLYLCCRNALIVISTALVEICLDSSPNVLLNVCLDTSSFLSFVRYLLCRCATGSFVLTIVDHVYASVPRFDTSW